VEDLIKEYKSPRELVLPTLPNFAEIIKLSVKTYGVEKTIKKKKFLVNQFYDSIFNFSKSDIIKFFEAIPALLSVNIYNELDQIDNGVLTPFIICTMVIAREIKGILNVHFDDIVSICWQTSEIYQIDHVSYVLGTD